MGVNSWEPAHSELWSPQWVLEVTSSLRDSATPKGLLSKARGCAATPGIAAQLEVRWVSSDGFSR